MLSCHFTRFCLASSPPEQLCTIMFSVALGSNNDISSTELNKVKSVNEPTPSKLTRLHSSPDRTQQVYSYTKTERVKPDLQADALHDVYACLLLPVFATKE